MNQQGENSSGKSLTPEIEKFSSHVDLRGNSNPSEKNKCDVVFYPSLIDKQIGISTDCVETCVDTMVDGLKAGQ